MAVTTTKLGPGTLTLTLGAGTPLDVSCQLVSAQVEWDKNKDDDETTLCGDVVAGDTTYSATLSGTVFQDLAAVSPNGIVEFTWTNKGAECAFEFTPNTAAGATVAGNVTIDPLMIGGDTPKAKMRSDFKWDCVGEPTLTIGALAAAEA